MIRSTRAPATLVRVVASFRRWCSSESGIEVGLYRQHAKSPVHVRVSATALDGTGAPGAPYAFVRADVGDLDRLIQALTAAREAARVENNAR